MNKKYSMIGFPIIVYDTTIQIQRKQKNIHKQDIQ
jgi:hypothetical protein